MPTEVEDTPLFAEIAGEEAEHVLALIADAAAPPSNEELLRRHPAPRPLRR